MNRRQMGVALLTAVMAVLIVAVVRSCSMPQDVRTVPPSRPVIEERSIYPAGTPTPSGYRPGLVIVRDLFSGAGVTVTPMPGVVGSHLEIYWDDVQPDLTATPDWRAVQTRVAYLDSQDRDAWMSLEFYETNWNTTDSLHLPSGVPTVSYNGYNGLGTPCPEVAPDYGAAGFRNANATVVASMMSTFGNDPKVAGFALQMGASGEAMNVQNDGCTKRQYFETPVPCAEFLEAVELSAIWHRAGTNKPITLASGIAGCYQSSYNEDRKMTKTLFEALNLVPTTGADQYIGYRHNGLGTDNQRAFFSTPTPGPYGRMQYGYAHQDQGGVSFEPGSPAGFPTQVPTAERESYTDYMLLNAANAGADNVFLQRQWYEYVDPRVLDVITQTLGTTASDSPIAWVWFRGAEFAKTTDSATISYSGDPDPFTHLAAVVGAATPTTYCSPGVRATAQAVGGSNPPYACTQELAAPVARESRNTLAYQAGSTVGIDVADDWVHGGNVNNKYHVALRYLDNNSGSMVFAYKDTGGYESQRTINKAGSGAWVTESFTMTAALNDEYTTHDLEIRVSGAQTMLNSVVIEYAAADSTPTPTPTPSRTPTFTPTRTPTPSRTPGTTTPTFTPSPTPAWALQNCPTLAPTVDGSLADWAGVTGVTLTSSSAAYSAGSPTLSGTLYCAWSGSTLYVSGRITDTVVLSPAGSLANGDAVRITLDGLADGSQQFGVDDHDLLISPNGRIMDFEVYPVAATVATGAGGGAWTFEAALPGSLLTGSLSAGRAFGVVWGLVDDDDGGGRDGSLTAAKRRALLQ